EAYLARHPKAAFWVDFEDFSFWCLQVADVYFVGGFADMDWVTREGYATARPDPLADVGEEILAHMNRDHADALVTLARAHADAAPRKPPVPRVARLGSRVRPRSGEPPPPARINFPREIATAEACRAVLIEMLGQGRR